MKRSEIQESHAKREEFYFSVLLLPKKTGTGFETKEPKTQGSTVIFCIKRRDSPLSNFQPATIQ